MHTPILGASDAAGLPKAAPAAEHGLTLILGAGAMGCLFAASFAKAGLPLAVYDPDGEKTAPIQKEGVCLEEDGQKHLLTGIMAYSRLTDCPPPARMLLLVKAYHTAAAAADILRAGFGGLPLLGLQNGAGHGGQLAAALPQSPLCLGVTYAGARMLSPGRVASSGRGPTAIAPFAQAELSQAQDWAYLLTQAGFPAEALANAAQPLWQKLAVNAVINPLTALWGLTNGALLEHAEFPVWQQALLDEAVAVAQAEGVLLDQQALAAQLRRTCISTVQNHSSMLSDIEQGRPTEIEYINGAICRLGAAHDLPTPAHQHLYQEIKSLEGRR